MSKNNLQKPPTVWYSQPETRRIYTTHNFTGCPRCGQDHPELQAIEFQRPVKVSPKISFNAFALCPTTMEPILIEIGKAITGKEARKFAAALKVYARRYARRVGSEELCSQE